ncbi:TrkH family potassium uptake protein [Nonomuraea sp. SBT364]|uniref:TrkH family potassium uptake protein n=1 Tax=Nonomuraea sp. SBT364 TaxID=1580530 RepID=UPI00066EB813|nr:potassium transporter TrkG [Nonomuraea sp. SBT364]
MRRVRAASFVLGGYSHPAQVIATGFSTAALVGTLLLALPFATTEGVSAGWLTAVFTATSAVCLTGLVIVDTPTHWSMFGELVIIGLVQIGGLGIMTLATVFTVLVSGRLGLRARLFAQAETKTPTMADMRKVVRKVVVFSLVCEALAAVVFTLRFLVGYDEPLGHALYLGIFHGISAFNNAGFALWSDNIMGFVTDPWICLTIAAAVTVGGLGFPVVFELLKSWRHPSRWSVLTRITVVATVVLLILGTLVYLATEWRNPGTLGALDDSGKLLAGFFLSAMARTAGFNSVDISQLYPSSWLFTDLMMFIGGGSAGTAGGIKVTTLGLLAFVMWAELRGESKVNIGHRQISESAQRQAVTITMMSAGLVAVCTYVLLVLTPHSLDRVLFEVVATFSTAGLSTGITADVTTAGQVLMVLLMFVGRIGPLTIGSALALKERTRHYELPEERMIVG